MPKAYQTNNIERNDDRFSEEYLFHSNKFKEFARNRVSIDSTTVQLYEILINNFIRNVLLQIESDHA